MGSCCQPGPTLSHIPGSSEQSSSHGRPVPHLVSRAWGSGGFLTSGSQAIVLEVQSFQPMQPGELPGVDFLQLVVLGAADRGGEGASVEAQGSCLSRGSPPPSPRSQSLCWAPPLGFSTMQIDLWLARAGSKHGRPGRNHNREQVPPSRSPSWAFIDSANLECLSALDLLPSCSYLVTGIPSPSSSPQARNYFGFPFLRGKNLWSSLLLEGFKTWVGCHLLQKPS